MPDQPPTGMDSFNLVTLRLLDRLYDSFPRPLNISRDVANEISFSAVPDATEEQAWEIATMATDVVEWLAEEGFLRYEKDPNHKHGVFWKVRLSLKGLTILGSIPAAVQTKEVKQPLIAKVKDILKSGSEKVASESTKLVVSEIFKYALASSAVVAKQLIQI